MRPPTLEPVYTSISDRDRNLATGNTEAAHYQRWQWLNLMSLDAPLVALLWQGLLAGCYHVDLHWPATASLALAVWFIYLADRWLDAGSPGLYPMPARHEFARAHRGLLLGMTLGVGAALFWSCAHLSRPVLRSGLWMAAAVAVYMMMVHAAPQWVRRIWPKEVAVGILFALGTCLATWAQMGSGRERLLAPVLLLAGLCWINCTAIEYWEWRRLGQTRAHPDPIHRWTRLAGEHLGALAGFIGLAAVLLLAFETPRAALAATLMSASGFLWLNRRSGWLPLPALRVLADAALFSPVLIYAASYGWLHRL